MCEDNDVFAEIEAEEREARARVVSRLSSQVDDLRSTAHEFYAHGILNDESYEAVLNYMSANASMVMEMRKKNSGINPEDDGE